MTMNILVYFLISLAPSFAAAMEPMAFNPKVVTFSASNPARISITFDSRTLAREEDSTVAIKGGDWVLPGEGQLTVEGKPLLPAISRFVVIPPDKSVELVIRDGSVRRVAAERSPKPFAADTEQVAMKPKKWETNGGGLFPPEISEMSDPMVIRGVRLVRVTTYPVQFEEQTQTWLIHDHIEADLRFSNNLPANPVQVPIRRHRSQTFLKFIRILAINGDRVGRDDPDLEIEPAYAGHYLVVSVEECLAAAAPFIEWRRKAGYKVDIFSVPSNHAQDTLWVKNGIQTRYDSYLDQGIDPFDMILLIGDHSYGGMEPREEALIANPNYGWDYTLLEGDNNDFIPDVAFGHWIAGSTQQLTLFREKTLSYEMTPYFENTDWFERAGVFSQRWGNNSNSSVQTSVRWAKAMMAQVGYKDVRFYEDLDADENGFGVGEFMANQLNDGVSVLIGRAQANWLNIYYNDLQGTDVYPIYINYAGHQEFITWCIMRTWNGRDIKGPVAATNVDGIPTTLSNNVLWMENISAMFQRDLPFGWARIQGVIAPELYLPNYDFHVNARTSAAYGDPGLQPWIGVPKVVHAVCPDIITPATRSVQVKVLDDLDDQPVEGAQVTLYFPGEIPDSASEDYPDYDGMVSLTKKSNSEGFAHFILEEGTPLGVGLKMFVTVTGRDIKPFLDSRNSCVPEAGMELACYTLSQVEGNNDDLTNPGETWSIDLTAVNLGDRSDLPQVTATVQSASPWLEVEPAQLTFSDVSAGDSAMADQPITLRFSPSCPDGMACPLTRPTISIDFASGDQHWQSGLQLLPVAPHFEIAQVVGGFEIPDSMSQLNLELKNIGNMDSPSMTGELHTLGMGVSVIRGSVNFPAICVGQNARIDGNLFIIGGNKIVVPGSKNPMMLILRTDGGFVDTTNFDLQVMHPREATPQGPDKYGYICFDDTDTLWGDMAPVYDWVEIDPHANNPVFQGNLLAFEGLDFYNMGQATVVPLPFETQFYGMVLDTITIARNGFVSMGSQPLAGNFQNWPLDRAIGGGVGMIAPLWDDLTMGNGGGIYYYHDVDNGRFIVEWSKLRLRSGARVDLIFQVMILDRTVWITESGDQNIIIQYKSIENQQGNAGWNNETPYASVGISSPRGDTGLSYTWNNEYPVTSAPLQNRRALLFSTSPRYRAGILYGYVTDVTTGLPIEGATVITKQGFKAITDQDGYWRIGDALAEINFSLTAHKQGCNDSTYSNQLLPENDSLRFDFALLHPEFSPSTMTLSHVLDPDRNAELPFTLSNTGNGPLSWRAEKRLLGDANAPQWALRRSYMVGATVDDDRIEGVAFGNDRFYVSGANRPSSSTIYVLDREGALVDTFAQPGNSVNGMKDLEWDGDLLWGSGERNIYGFTTTGELVVQFAGPNNPNTCIAWDSDENIFWISNTTSDPVAYDRAGNRLGRTLNRHGLRIYGLAYWPEDPDGHKLYIMNSPANNVQVITKMSSQNSDTMFVRTLTPELGGTAGGIFICNTYDVYSWVMMSIANTSIQEGRDRIDIYQLDAYKDWLNLNSWAGTLQTGETQDFILSLNSIGLPDTLFEANLHFTHNATGGEADLAVQLRVIGNLLPSPFSLLEPANGDSMTAFPLHGDTLRIPAVTFFWQPSFDPNFDDTVRYTLQINTGMDSLSIFNGIDTSRTVSFDSLNLHPSFEHPIVWNVQVTSGNDIISSNERFQFTILPDVFDRSLDIQPVEFGLHGIYPNPFNAMTTVQYGIDEVLPTTLKLFDLTGREVKTLLDGVPKVGNYVQVIDGAGMSSGLYYLRLESGGRTNIAKLVMVK
jgi:hypothetical protein